jgi:hypothetical protein
MIKKYKFDYNNYEAECVFEVDDEKFTEEMAFQTLDFFSWYYDKEENPITEVLKKYAIEVIKIATFNNYNTYGVIEEFKNNEGFGPVDGTIGLKLISVEGYEFDTDNLEITIEDK